jgi:erythromycin esterase-like protein
MKRQFGDAGCAIQDFKSWAAESAIKLDLSASCRENARRLGRLYPLVAGKRLAFVGEPDHFIHEKYPYRALMLDYLAGLGFMRVGEELSRTDGARIDRFIETGDASHLDRVASYGYRGGVRDDRDDTPVGVLKDAYGDKYPLAEFRAEQVRFAHSMRALSGRLQSSGANRLRFFGFDVDANPGCAYEDLAAMLAAHSDDAVVESVLNLLKRVPGESLDAEVHRLDAVVAAFAAELEHLAAVLGADAAHEARYLAQWLRDSFAYLRAIIPITRWEDLNPAMAERELMMHREVTRQIELAKGKEKLVLLSHNAHLCRDMSAIAGMTAAAGPGGKSAPPLGEFLSRRFAGQVFSIWMLIGQGRDRQQFRPLTDVISLVPGSLNAILADIGECFLLPIDRDEPRARLLETPLQLVMDGNVSLHTAPASQADALFFIRDVTPIREGSLR